MCAWKRGTQNNVAGPIRKGHIREFSQRILRKEENLKIASEFRIADLSLIDLSNVQWEILSRSSIAVIPGPISNLHVALRPFVISLKSFDSGLAGNIIYLHAHEFPLSVVTVYIDEFNIFSVPSGNIALTQAMRINSKVCVGEVVQWSVYGEYYNHYRMISYDCRSGAIGNTHLRRVEQDAHNSLAAVVISARTLSDPQGIEEPILVCDGAALAEKFKKAALFGIVTVEDLLVLDMEQQIVVRVTEVRATLFNCENLDEEEGEEEMLDVAALSDDFRGFVGPFTTVYLDSQTATSRLQILNRPSLPQPTAVMDPRVVQIFTSDGETFPVKRRLLRPCVALTSLVQAGRGKYRHTSAAAAAAAAASKKEDCQAAVQIGDAFSASVDMDACTFDRVLLYLEHEARGESFQFDPLLAVELREAAILLGIAGLQAACEKVLGSFEERVRKVPIRLDDVLERNTAGSGSVGRRGETLLLMDGMVLDVTRWLDEHPGGSQIIPEQALGVDCTIFFEIYHASRQAYLYLKEFYIGELALADRSRVPLPPRTLLGIVCNNEVDSSGLASEAFMEQLRAVTPWRLDAQKMPQFEDYKSF